MNFVLAITVLVCAFAATLAASSFAIRRPDRKLAPYIVAIASIALVLDIWLYGYRLYIALLKFSITEPAVLTIQFVVLNLVILAAAICPLLLSVGIVALLLKRRFGLYVLVAAGLLWLAQFIFLYVFTLRLG